MKRVISIILALCMCFLMSATAFANNTQTEVLTLNGETYLVTITDDVVTVIDENNGYQATYNQKTGIVSVMEINDNSSIVRIDLHDIIYQSTESNHILRASGSDSNSSTDNAYSYERETIDDEDNRGQFWTIQIPNKIKMTWAHTNNISPLDDFADTVDEMRELEDTIDDEWGSAVLTLVITFAAGYTTAGWQVALAAALASVATSDSLENILSYAENINACCEDCESYFEEVLVYTEPSD